MEVKNELIYIAGIMDSGCHITIEKQTTIYRAIVTVNRRSLEVIKVLQNFGGKTRQVQNKNSWKWKIVGKQAYQFLRAIQPYMLTKQMEIQLLFELEGCAEIRGATDRREKIRQKLHV
jgi:hypothetical protein